MSRRLVVPQSWVQIIATRWVFAVNPRCRLSAPWASTNRSNSSHGKCFSKEWNTLFSCGTALLLSCPGTFGDVRSRVESMPCTTSAKIVPDSRGLGPGIHELMKRAADCLVQTHGCQDQVP